MNTHDLLFNPHKNRIKLILAVTLVAGFLLGIGAYHIWTNSRVLSSDNFGIVCNDKTVRLMDGPSGKSHKVRKVMERGNIIRIVETVTSEPGHDWYKIKDIKGEEGYVDSYFVLTKDKTLAAERRINIIVSSAEPEDTKKNSLERLREDYGEDVVVVALRNLPVKDREGKVTTCDRALREVSRELGAENTPFGTDPMGVSYNIAKDMVFSALFNQRFNFAGELLYAVQREGKSDPLIGAMCGFGIKPQRPGSVSDKYLANFLNATLNVPAGGNTPQNDDNEMKVRVVGRATSPDGVTTNRVIYGTKSDADEARREINRERQKEAAERVQANINRLTEDTQKAVNVIGGQVQENIKRYNETVQRRQQDTARQVNDFSKQVQSNINQFSGQMQHQAEDSKRRFNENVQNTQGQLNESMQNMQRSFNQGAQEFGKQLNNMFNQQQNPRRK